LVSDS